MLSHLIRDSVLNFISSLAAKWKWGSCIGSPILDHDAPQIIEARTQTEAVLTGEEFSQRKEEWTERRKRKAKGVTTYKKGHTATRGEGLKITFSKVYIETRTPFAKKRQKVDLTKKRPNADRSEGSEEEVLQWLTKKRPKPKD